MDITVVIPVHNQALPLSLTLQAFARQDVPPDRFRIVIVDDGSAEPISAVVESYKEDLNLCLIRIPRSGRAFARNVGARKAKGGLLVFCDADRMPRPQFISAHAEAFKRYEESVCVGQVREMYVAQPERNRKLLLESFISAKRDRIPQYCRLVYSLFDQTGRTESPIAWVAALSGNLSLPVSLFCTLQGFDERFSEWGFEHMEFGYRAAHALASFRYLREAINVHIAHPRGSGSYKSYIQNSHNLFYSKHPEPEVFHFLDFMLGQMSLRDFERVAGGDGVGEDGFVKITNFSR
ncbi:glycosyltransferase family 2 protein [Cohnella soli]|uniref:Glycosyltransferase family 2 protein n=1 Tax=Cohnella soli TaxID=425005 RepID=A0ABW0I3Y7_9BACL